MTDLVQKLVGALEGQISRHKSALMLLRCDDEFITKQVADAEAALSEAKAGGWVAVPVEMTDEMRDAGNEWIGNRFLLGKAYAAMLAARPLTNPPKEQNT